MNPAPRVDIVEVAFDPRSSGGIGPYSYLNAHRLKVGDLVLAPVGPRQILGAVIEVKSALESDLTFDASHLRPTQPPIQGLQLADHFLKLAEFVSQATLSNLGQALALSMPPGVHDRLVTQISLRREPGADDQLTTIQQEVVRTIQDAGGQLVISKNRPLAAASMRSLTALAKKGIIDRSMTVGNLTEKQAMPEVITLAVADSEVEKFLSREGKRKPAQAVVLMRLMEAAGVELTLQELKAICGVTDTTIKTLLKAGLIQQHTLGVRELTRAPKLNPHQAEAAHALVEAIRAGKYATHLLYGITGSGKTEVFLRAAEEALKLGRQVLYLVPEIALTAQVIGQLRGRFGNLVSVLHSSMSPTERLKSWTNIRNGTSPMILGPRSALFAPFQSLGLIIMDEEHEGSYKQENAPRYHSKDVARFLAECFNATYVGGSATPSCETFHEALEGRTKLLTLPERAANAQLPAVTIEDLRLGYQSGTPSLLTPALHQKIEERLQKQEQCVLFLNRRAYAPFLECRECGFSFECPNCAVTLAFHKRTMDLRCHYCDHRQPAPTQCPSCSGMRVRTLGMGTEKVEETIRELFPNARVARLDRDVTQKKGVLEEVLAGMQSRSIDILIGTQMVAKGLDFAGVTLVGVISADTALHFPDFRAAERTFQLLCQVSGRSGRGKSAGEVVIQTFSPEHPAIRFAQQHDFRGFFDHDLSERATTNYPPFCRLINLVVSGEELARVRQVCDGLANCLRGQYPDDTILGPVDCVLERLNNRYRRHILVKLRLDVDIQAVRTLVDSLDHDGTQIMVDVDPHSML